MAHFPVTNSNLSAVHLALFLREKYTLSSLSECKIIRAGINDTYLVSGNPVKYIFRIYSLNWRTKSEILEEISLLLQLKQHDIPVSYPLADKNKNYIQSLNAPEGERFAVLFSFAEGEKTHNVSVDVHYQIGVLMARMHQVTHNLTLNRVHYTHQVLLVDSMEQLSKFLNAGSEEMEFMQSTQKYLFKALSNVSTSEIRKGAVHLDIWFDNLNITNDKQVTVFDFDFCGNGWLCMDIAYYILQLHNIERYEEKEYRPKIDSFLKGYESITPISSEEKRLIPILGISLYYFYLGIQCQRFDNWSNSFLSENYLKRYINGLIKKYYIINDLDLKDS
jgi:Ser/Thr protein kinase RdoA (MazF antagonist)